MSRRRWTSIACVAVLGSALALTSVDVQAAPARTSGNTDHARIVVVYAAGVSAQGRARATGRANAVPVRTLGRDRFQLVKPATGRTVEQTIASLKAQPRVLTAVADQTFHLQSVPNDQWFSQQWGLQNTGQTVLGVAGTAGADIDATQAWDRTTGSPSVMVADLDSGYRFDHPDLAPVAWTNTHEIPGNGIDDDHNGYVDDVRGWDALDHDPDATDPSLFQAFPGDPGTPVPSHGVHTAGIIGARGSNTVGVTGVAQNARIMPVRVCLILTCQLSAILEGINYAGLMGARAANLSITGYPTDPGVGLAMTTAFAANPKTLYVTAAGNQAVDADGGGTRPFPCASDPAVSDPSIGYVAAAGAVDNVLCVAATDQSDVLASFSNFGAHSVDLAAPGVNVLSTSFDRDDVYAENGFATWFTPVPPATDASQGWQTYPAPGGGGTVIASDPPTFVGTPSTQVAGTTRATESQNIPVGTQYQECTFSFIAGANQAGDDAFSWSLTLDGTSVFDGPVADTDPTSGKNDLTFAVPSSPVTHQMRISFRFFHGASGATSPWAGAELLRLQCVQGNDRFDSGTSMATPMVTGTAALLFSLKPTATVSQARKAILKGVDPIAGLAGKTVTGGRLDAWRAMNAFLPLDTRITSGPSGHVRATRARFAFDTNKTGPATGYQCRLDATRWKSCTSPTSLRTLSLGKHTFRVRSVLPGGADTTPATRTWTIIK